MGAKVTGGARPARRTRLTPEARRAQVLAAAREVFLVSGSQGATVKGIAEAAGVTEMAIYHHFASKEELFRRAVEEPLHRMVTTIHTRMQELVAEPGMSRRRLLATANETFLGAMVDIAPLLAVTLFGKAEQGRDFYATEIWPQLEAAVEALISAGWAVERADKEMATMGFLGVHYSVVMDAVLSDETLDVPMAAAHITALFEGSIGADIQPSLPRVPQPAAAPMRRERAGTEERRRLILDAARAAFLEKGLAGARMKDIAERAGMTDAGLYTHFASKDELYRAAVLEPLERLATSLTTELRSLTAAHNLDRADLVLRAHEALLGALVEMGPLLTLALFSDLEPGRAFYTEVLLPALGEATSVLVNNVYGPASTGDPEAVADVILGAHLGITLDNLIRGRDVDVPLVAARLSKLIVLPQGGSV